MVTQSFRAVCAGFPSRKGILAPVMMGLMLPILAGSLARAQGSPLPAAAVTQSAKSVAPAGPVAGTAGPSAKETAPAAPPNSESEERPAKSGGDAIHVHGHWIIEVRNPDGKVTARREFENSLTPAGQGFLEEILAGWLTAGGMSVLLNGASLTSASLTTTVNSLPFYYTDYQSTETGPCASIDSTGLITSSTTPVPTPGFAVTFSGSSGNGSTCLLTMIPDYGEYSALTWACSYIQSQTTNTNSSGTSPCSTLLGDNFTKAGFTLSGRVQVTAPAPGQVNDVETVYTACAQGSSTLACFDYYLGSNQFSGARFDSIGLFTERTLDGQNGDPAPVPYQPGQTIAVTVTLTFQ